MSTSNHAHTRHSATRARQRAITDYHIDLALAHGRQVHTHGDLSYTLDDRSLRNTPYAHLTDRLRGLTVVVTSEGIIRTVKWNHRTRRRPGILRGTRTLSAQQGGAA